MSFPLILVLITFISGIYWLIDSVFFAPKRTGEEPILVEYARSFFPVLAIVLILRSFIFEPFRIPSGSMIPTLLVGDFILVSKYSYGVRLPVIHTKILDTGAPETGDVAVFRFPRDPKIDYIKRVVGVPGDKILIKGKKLVINDISVNYSAKDSYVLPGTDAIKDGVFQMSESLGDGVHEILVNDTGSVGEQSFKVPEGMYFMLGDNRDSSNDSRYWGFVPEANLVGKAKYVWMHWNKGILWSRLGEKIE